MEYALVIEIIVRSDAQETHLRLQILSILFFFLFLNFRQRNLDGCIIAIVTGRRTHNQRHLNFRQVRQELLKTTLRLA